MENHRLIQESHRSLKDSVWINCEVLVLNPKAHQLIICS